MALIITKKEFMKKVKKKKWKFNYNEWLNISLHEKDSETLLLFALCSTKESIEMINKELRKNSNNCVCYSFICGNYPLTDDILKKLSIISSEIFSFKYYDDQLIDVLFEIIKGKYGHPEKFIDNLNYHYKNVALKLISEYDGNTHDKIDWENILNNPNLELSKQFIIDNKDYITSNIKMDSLNFRGSKNA